MHWPDGAQVNFDIHASVPSEYRDTIKAAGDRYNDILEVTGIKIFEDKTVKDFRGIPLEVTGDGSNSIYWVRDEEWPWKESDPNAIAMTVTTFDKNNISEADIFYKSKSYQKDSPDTKTKATATVSVGNNSSASLDFSAMNPIQDFLRSTKDTLFPNLKIASNQILQAVYDTSSINHNLVEHRVYMVSVHEMGHAMGRCHSDEPASIMWPQVGTGDEETRNMPFSDEDLDLFESAYKIHVPESK